MECEAKAFCSLGHPGEDFESANNLKSWIIEAAPDDFDVNCYHHLSWNAYLGWEEKSSTPTQNGRRICRYTKRSKNSREDGATLFFDEVDYTKEWTFYKGKPGSM